MPERSLQAYFHSNCCLFLMCVWKVFTEWQLFRFLLIHIFNSHTRGNCTIVYNQTQGNKGVSTCNICFFLSSLCFPRYYPNPQNFVQSIRDVGPTAQCVNRHYTLFLFQKTCSWFNSLDKNEKQGCLQVILDYIFLDLGYYHIMICDKLSFPGCKGCIAVKWSHPRKLIPLIISSLLMI